MQLMSWILARLGSRFQLLFEPHKRQIRHSALGRFLDQPVDLMVGLVEPDGTERVLPFSQRGSMLYNCEQFERLNSITYRGYSEKYRLRFEFNVHSVFYPQDEELCTLPAFYLEMRLTPSPPVRLIKQVGKRPGKVKMFIRLARPDTQIVASSQDGFGRIDLTYQCHTVPRPDEGVGPFGRPLKQEDRWVPVRERIVSLNGGCVVDADGKGLTYEMPVTEESSGIKWRLVWGAHCGEPVLRVKQNRKVRQARFKYASRLPDIDAVMKEAIDDRDDRLGHSRRFEKLFDQASLIATQRHLMNQSWHAFHSNTYLCQLDDGETGAMTNDEWFSVMEGSSFFHSTLDDEYNCSMFYLSLWPRLLAMQLKQWPMLEKPHKPSGAGYLSHDMGRGCEIGEQAYDHDMPVEENCNYMLLMQAYAHWTGDLTPVQEQAALLERLAKYLIWTDRDGSGFPSEGTPNTLDDAAPASQVARKQTYLAVKRIAALSAAADLLSRVERPQIAQQCEQVVADDRPKIEHASWLGDHYAVCVDRSSTGVIDVRTGEPLPEDEIPGWDAYSISTGNGLLLPLMCGRPLLLDKPRLAADLYSAMRETLSPYGCGHSSLETENVWVSQNLWRDHLGGYLDLSWPPFLAQRYWDLQVMSNTHLQSLGFVDTYIGNNLSFFPRGVTSIGYLLAQPRLVIDRLATGSGAHISVNPDRHVNQRIPLLPLADWKAGKIPVCVVDAAGRVTIEGQVDPVTIIGDSP